MRLRFWRRNVLKLTVRFDGNEFTVDGETTFAAVEPLLSIWLALQHMSGAATEAELMALSERLQKSNAKLGGAIAGAT